MDNLFKIADVIFIIMSVVLAVVLIYGIFIKGIAVAAALATLALDIALGAFATMDLTGGKN